LQSQTTCALKNEKSSGALNMRKIFFQIFVLTLLTPFLISGCWNLVIGSAAAGAGTAGTYFYVKGELKTDYQGSFNDVWTACEKTIAGMHGIEVVPQREIARGTIETIINNEKVKFDLTYKSKNVTTVAIRVGLIGNKLSSQLLHDKIADNLVK
jgi:hypothetical protein